MNTPSTAAGGEAAPEVATEASQPTLARSDQNLVWLDCEMTGLDPEVERLIEIAVVVTGPHLSPRIEGPVLVIHQSDAVLDAMDAWNKGTHGRRGSPGIVNITRSGKIIGSKLINWFALFWA